MFERFTVRARSAIVLATEEAKRLWHTHVGTEHLLLGLLHEGRGIAAQALDDVGITLVEARHEVEEIVPRGPGAPSGHPPFTPRSKKVLELSLQEALQLGHDYIGTEHLLLALVREGEGVGAQVLPKLGVDPDRVRQQVLAILPPTTTTEVLAEQFHMSAEEIEGLRETLGSPSRSVQGSLGLLLRAADAFDVDPLALAEFIKDHHRGDQSTE